MRMCIALAYPGKPPIPMRAMALDIEFPNERFPPDPATPKSQWVHDDVVLENSKCIYLLPLQLYRIL